jgi:hypothetical protein
VTIQSAHTPGAVAAATLLVLTFGGDAKTASTGSARSGQAATLPCNRLALMTRAVRWELRDHVEDYYQHLRAAETRLAQGRWENVYEREPDSSGELGKYVSLAPHPCGQPSEVDIDPDARAEYALGRAFGAREADRLSDSLDGATFTVSLQVFRPIEPNTPIPWRDLGALFMAITRTEVADGNPSGPGLRLVSAAGSTRSYLWIRPATAGAGTQIFRFRADLSSPR